MSNIKFQVTQKIQWLQEAKKYTQRHVLTTIRDLQMR